MMVPPRPVALHENRHPDSSAWPPLPGSAAFLQHQAELDCATLKHLSACLRQTASKVAPLLDTLYFKAAPLAVLECSGMLEALAQEVEQDDVQSVMDRAYNS
nr:hypothetical protein [uncultured Acetobacter sp.]